MVTDRCALYLQTLCGRPNPSFKIWGLYFTLSSHHSRYCQLVFTLFSVFTLNHLQTSAIYYTRVCVPLPDFFFFLLFTLATIWVSPQKVSMLDYWEIVVKCTYSHEMFNSWSSLIIDLGRYQAVCDYSECWNYKQQRVSLVVSEK